MAIKSDFCKVQDCGKPRDKSQGSSMCTMHRVRWSRFKSHELPIKTLPEGVVHICKVHGELTEEQAYTNDKYTSYQCRECKKIAMSKFDEKNPNRDTNILKTHIYIGSSNFKILKTEYNSMLEAQNGLCKICGKPETTLKNSTNRNEPRKLSIDHCHILGEQGILKVRGLLCHRCNSMIASNKDKSKMSIAAINYLKAHA